MQNSDAISKRIATGVAYVVNPFLLPPLLFGLVLGWSGAPAADVGLAAGGVFLLMTAVPATCLWGMVKSGRVPSVTFVAREERGVLFVIGIGCTLLAATLLAWLLEPTGPIILAIGACIVVSAAMLALLNLRWKISIHAAAISGFVAVLLHLSSEGYPLTDSGAALWVIPLIPLVMWARVRTRAHTLAEVIGGAVVGLLGPLLTLWVLTDAGLR